MERGKGTGVGIGEMVVSAEERQRDTERAAQLLGQAEEELGVVVQEVPLDAIEPDPMQPRRFFDEEKRRSLAASIQKYGLLQEPGVVPVASDAAELPTRFRLIWGERRWRIGDLVEKVGTQRGLNGMVARNLISLLKTPWCLQTA